MGDDSAPESGIDRRLEAEPITVGERSVQPVARLTGRRFGSGNEHGSFSAAAVQLKPLEIVVREGEEEYTIPIVEPQREPLRALLITGIAVAAGCVLVMIAAGRIARRCIANSQATT
jgi:hypothetical protein